jgi:type I restriction enzyme, S subunit
MSEWKEFILEDVIDKFIDYRGKTPKKTTSGVPLITAKVVKNGTILEPNEFIAKDDYDNWMTRGLPEVNDVVLTTEAPLGEVALIKDANIALAQRIITLRGKQDVVFNSFLKYFFQSSQGQYALDSRASGTTVFGIKAAVLRKLPIELPPLPEQKAIAEVLSSLDDKIDLLHRQNKTLEKMAETLFRQWFVEEAKEEWEIGKLSHEFDFVMGASPAGESYNEDGIGIPMYQGNADFGFRFPTNRVFTTDPKRFAEKYDTLISVRAPVGAQNMAKEKCCIGRGVAAFRYKLENSFYTYTYFKMKSLMGEIKQFNETGTVFGSISKSDFETIEVNLPDTESVVKFQDAVKPIDDKIISNTNQIRTLEKLRDTLLPKLMSGEVRVSVK